MEELLTINEVSKILKLSPRTLYNLISLAKIPHIKLSGRAVRFRPSDIEAWLIEKTKLEAKKVGKTVSIVRLEKTGKFKGKNRFLENLIENAKKDALAEI